MAVRGRSAGLTGRRLLLLAGLLVLPAGCGRAPSEHASGPAEGALSGILITLDTTRADALSSYGVTSFTTPNLDRLRRESLQFEAAYTVAPLTLVAHASMLTGLYPLRHGVRDNGQFRLPDEAHTLAESASASGAQTAAFISAFVLAPQHGLAQGFDTYDVPGFEGRWEDERKDPRFAREVVDAAVDWLGRRDRDRPFFLWLHFFDPHAPYIRRKLFDPVVRSNPSYPSGDYLLEVAYLDKQVGRLLDALKKDGALDQALLLVVADHGESLKAHDEETHGAYCYEESLRVPLLIRDPGGHRAGESSAELVSVVDVHPTLREAMGLRPGSSEDGVSLFRRDAPADRGLYFECYSGYLSYGWSPLAGWIDRQGKYLHSSRPEFFRLDEDPLEQNNLLESGVVDVTRYIEAIDSLASRPALESAFADQVSDESIAMLRELGYAGSGLTPDRIPHPLAPSDRPSPASRSKAHHDTMRALGLVVAEKYQEAVDLLRPVVAENPGNFTAMDQLALGLMRLGRHEEAIPYLENLVAHGPPYIAYLFNLGQCFKTVGRLDEAIKVFRSAAARQPDQPSILKNLAEILREAGRGEEEREVLDSLRALEGS